MLNILCLMLNKTAVFTLLSYRAHALRQSLITPLFTPFKDVQGHYLLIPIESPYVNANSYLSNYRLWQRVPLVNALVLGNVFEYCHKSCIAKNYIFGLHFRRRQYGSAFNQFDVVCLKKLTHSAN